MTRLSIDEYIFLMWVRSLSHSERTLFYEYIKTGNPFLVPLCIGFLHNYPYSLLNLAISVGKD